jgi:hypothetical protein
MKKFFSTIYTFFNGPEEGQLLNKYFEAHTVWDKLVALGASSSLRLGWYMIISGILLGIGLFILNIFLILNGRGPLHAYFAYGFICLVVISGFGLRRLALYWLEQEK